MVAALNYGVIENIKISGEVSGKETTGGIVARNGVCAEVKNCINYANINGDHQCRRHFGIWWIN